MRKYEQTHRWLSFKANLQSAPPSLWMNLGEAKSKCEHLANEPLRPKTAKILHNIFLAKGALATTAIEGNTLTEEEVRQQIEGKLEVSPSREYLKQEVENIINACNSIGEKLISGGGSGIGVETIRQFNRLVLDKLSLPKETIPGQIRSFSILVGPYRGAPAEDCEHLLIKLCDWIGGADFDPPMEAQRIPYAILKSIIAHLYLAWIHPFGDGNGRTARLVEFQILLAAGVPSPAAHLLSNHYNQTRQEYYRQLDIASKSGGDIVPFINYAVQGFVDGLKYQLSLVKVQQFDIVWRNFVHESFNNQDGVSARRQKCLGLELGAKTESISINKITELSPKVAKHYANKTIRTVQRDILSLEVHGIIAREKEGIRANREIILGFLPPTIKADDKKQMLLL